MSLEDETVRNETVLRDDTHLDSERLAGVVGAAASGAAKHRTRRPFGSAVMRAVFTLLVLLVFLMVGSVAFAGATAVGLGTARHFAVLAHTTITNIGQTTINGNVGLHPGSSVTGFGACPPPPANCVTLNGALHVADPNALQAKNALDTAYNNAAGQGPVTTIGTELGGSTLNPGVYDSAAGTFGITGTVTLNALGDPDGVFIFKMESTLITATSSVVSLQGQAQACNVYWVVGSSATLATASTFVGNIMAYASISVKRGVTVHGRLLARTGQVSLIADTITRATCAASGPGPTPTPRKPPPTSTLPGSGETGSDPTDALLVLAGLLPAAWLVIRRARSRDLV